MEREQRLTIVSQVTLQTGRHAAQTIETRQADAQLVTEEAWQRNLIVGPEFTPIEAGWIKTPGRIVLKNQEPKKEVVPVADQPIAWLGTKAHPKLLGIGAGELLTAHWNGEPMGLHCTGAKSVEVQLIVTDAGKAPDGN